MSSISTHLFGKAGFFHPRLPCLHRASMVCTIWPARERLRELIGFGRLNDGPLRITTIIATDLHTGDPVLFDSQAETIGVDHLLQMPAFYLNSVRYPSKTNGSEMAVFLSTYPLIPFLKYKYLFTSTSSIFSRETAWCLMGWKQRQAKERSVVRNQT